MSKFILLSSFINIILNEINRGYIGSLYVDDIKCIKKSDELKLRLKNIHE